MRDLEAENKRLIAIMSKGDLTQSPKSKAVYRCVNLYDNKIAMNRSLEFCPKSTNLNNTSLVAEKALHHNISIKAINRTSLNLINTGQVNLNFLIFMK